MKANELRIGNKVIIDGHETTITDNIMFDYDEGAWYVDDINITIVKPIPLTEDWLLKFGFKYDVFCWEFKGHQIRLIVAAPYPYWIDSSYICNVEYVHQLQNLYFALTQTELICLN